MQPPKLYDLTTLQSDANCLFGFTAKQTIEYSNHTTQGTVSYDDYLPDQV